MLSCSWCGERSENEFDLLAVKGAPGGEWSIERWWHRSGCGRPVVLARNLTAGDAFPLQPAGAPAGPAEEAPAALASPDSAPADNGRAAPAEPVLVIPEPGPTSPPPAEDSPPPAEGARPGPTVEVGVGDALTVATTPGGGVVGYRWPRVAEGDAGACPPVLFSFNAVGARLAGSGSEAGERPDPTQAARPVTPPVPEGPEVSPGAAEPDASEQAPDPAEPVTAARPPSSELDQEVSEAGDDRFGERARRRRARAMRRPMAVPVAGRSVPAAAREPDLTRRAPVAVTARRADARTEAPAHPPPSAADELPAEAVWAEPFPACPAEGSAEAAAGDAAGAPTTPPTVAPAAGRGQGRPEEHA